MANTGKGKHLSNIPATTAITHRHTKSFNRKYIFISKKLNKFDKYL